MLSVPLCAVAMYLAGFGADPATTGFVTPVPGEKLQVGVDRPDNTNLSILRIEAPGWGGEFKVWLNAPASGPVLHATLVGTAWFGDDPNTTFDAMVSLEVPLEHGSKLPDGDSYAFGVGGVTKLLERKELASDVTLWTSNHGAGFGSVEVWQAPIEANRLTDDIAVTVLLKLLENPAAGGERATGCAVSMTACLNAARSLADPGRVGSFSYACTQSGGHHACSFTLAPTLDDE